MRRALTQALLALPRLAGTAPAPRGRSDVGSPWFGRRAAAGVAALALAAACARGDGDASGASRAAAGAPPTLTEELDDDASDLASPTEAGAAGPEAAPAPGTKRAQLVLLAGGDVNLGREVGQRLLADADYDPLGDLAPLLARADLTFVNLESVLSDQQGETQSPRNRLVFTGPPEGGRALARAGIDLVSLANNHAWDYGRSALFQTFASLEDAGVAYVGASRTPRTQYEPSVIRVKGWSVAFFAVTHIWNQGAFGEHDGRHHVAWAAFDELRPHLRQARQQHDLVLVSYHGGAEYSPTIMQWTREFVRALMGAGVDAVLGHHPHVPQAVGWIGGKPVFHSLGNLVFAMHSDHPWTGTSFMARLTFHHDGALEAEACPYHILGHRPRLFEGKTRVPRERQLRSHLVQISKTAGGTGVAEPGEQSCMRLTPPSRRGAATAPGANP
ncbi:MAG: CapA family protein [Polyangiaceae bacterium]|nr:CapA family protein [Polyangiaceae bacterium]